MKYMNPNLQVNLLLWSCTITEVQKQRTWFPYETVGLG